jgi:dipeptidyl-peptidase 4
VQIKTADGFVMEGIILSPPRTDPNKKYPVWVKTYGGPHAPTIRDAWLAGRVEDQAHARAGYIVFRVDPRSASGKGAAATWTCYKQLGVQELKDLETAVQWICQRPDVDASRIGLSGHSYGGFLTSYALTHSKLFAAGIAGAPVTDWHLYDSIYTERYMLTPKENPDGYAKTSVVKAAKNLSGKLLILHGHMDDNVHVQNTLRLVDALQKADRDFELMIYPQARHPIVGKHYRRLMNEFMAKALRSRE